MEPLYLVDNLLAKYDVVCAFSEAQKRQAYQLRFNQIKVTFPGITYLEQVIDQFDRNSTHLLLQDRSSGRYIATIRVSGPVSSLSSRSTLPCQALDSDALVFIQQALNTGKHLSISEISKLTISPEFLDDEATTQSLSEAMYLAAFSLARLRFDDRVLLSLPIEPFKRLRARGLQLEQTTTRLDENSGTLFWLSSESGILNHSPIYELYQHILGNIAHQMNQPLLENDHYIAQENQ